ncbi:MAG: Gfo/Idh/MocA family oxidoreductase [Candidatus Korobacteraceae bacterium]
MIRFGIVGFGHHAVKRLMPGFAKAQRCRVTALSRRDPQRAQDSARQFGIAHAFTSTAELCACPEVDAVFVASPDALHLADAREALRNGKPVLVEKPMAMNSAEAATMVEAARKAGVLLGVAQNMRFERSVQWFRRKMNEGAIGKPLLARATFVAPMLSSPRTWVHDPKLATGGPLADIGVHCIDTLRYVLDDEVESVSMQAQYDSHSVLEASASGVLRFARGTLVNVAVSGRGAYETVLEIAGETGVVSAVNALTVDHPVTLELRRGFDILERTEVSNGDAYTLQLDAFAAAIEEATEFLVTGEDGLRNQLVLDAAFRSIKSGKTELVLATPDVLRSVLS